jgi:transcriptional regulator with XRE-family HTH domain
MTVKSQQESAGNASGLMGLDLKAIRESRGLDLNDVFRATKISVVNLEAIERGEFHLLPPPVYAKAYIKTYAKLLDADEEKALGRYERYLTAVADAGAKEPEPAQKDVAFPYKKLIIAVSLLIAACFMFYIVYLRSDFHTVLDIPASGDHSAKPQIKSADALDNATLPTATKAVVDSAASSRLVVKARETTWLRIREEGKPAFQILMKPGEKLERAISQFKLDVGNAGGISMEFRGKTIESLGKSGEVVHLRLP